MATSTDSLEEFLQPLFIDIPKIHCLAKSLCDTYARLAAESQEQFLPTPISDSVLRPQGDSKGRFLAIDIGGTNLRVGFIELGEEGPSSLVPPSLNGEISDNERSRVRRRLEKSWPIEELLKKDKAEDFFAWIGKCVAEVVQDGCHTWPEALPDEIPMGVTFSFPMIQHTLSDATLTSMGKGFAITSGLDLAKQLVTGYDRSSLSELPRIKIVAICNDAVATLVYFAYQYRTDPRRKPAMGLIVGTGCNATIPLALSKLHPSKRPQEIKVLVDKNSDTILKIAVNTEWTIKGAVGPLHELKLISRWDQILDDEGDIPGFQPFEYMTAGRYLGELGRLIAVDYFTNHLSIPSNTLPTKLLKRHGLTTAFLGNLGPHLQSSPTHPTIVEQLNAELPPNLTNQRALNQHTFQWTQVTADILFRIAKAVQVRAAGMTAAAIIGLLACADEISFHTPEQSNLLNGTTPSTRRRTDTDVLMVGYTGGCIVHFQDYLEDCQRFLNEIMKKEFGDSFSPKVLLQPCHDGGIMGAGILAGTLENPNRL